MAIHTHASMHSQSRSSMCSSLSPNLFMRQVHLELTTRKVIVTSWVEGVKLSQCDSEDVLELCDALLNCYLYQLLDTGFLHADPHPGNLLRTPDGRLCILDFGLVSEVDPDKRIHLVEYIAHLTMEDWEGLTQDLVALDFLPKHMTEEELDKITPVMKEVMGKLVTGGTAGISMGSLSLQLEGVARQYKMVVPPYFALVLRAFSVIEGIAMQHNGNYRIVGSCLPYLAQRLLGDNHPRMQAALRSMLYGSGTRLEAARLRRLLESLRSFRTGPPGTEVERAPRALQSPAAEIWGSAVFDDGMKQILKAIFSTRGTVMQVWPIPRAGGQHHLTHWRSSTLPAVPGTQRPIFCIGFCMPAFSFGACGASLIHSPVYTGWDSVIKHTRSLHMSHCCGGDAGHVGG